MKRNSRLIFRLLPLMLILLGFAIHDYLYLPVKAERESLGELADSKKAMLQKYVNAIAGKEALESRIAALKESRKTDEAGMVEGQTPSVAAANLQNMIKSIITEKGGTISSERVEKPENLNSYRVITVSVDAVLPEIKALGDVLGSLESNPVTLLTRELDVRVRNANDPRELMVKLKVSAINTGR